MAGRRRIERRDAIVSDRVEIVTIKRLEAWQWHHMKERCSLEERHNMEFRGRIFMLAAMAIFSRDGE